MKVFSEIDLELNKTLYATGSLKVHFEVNLIDCLLVYFNVFQARLDCLEIIKLAVTFQ